MEYKITEIKGTYDSNYPDSKKYVFRVDGYEHDLSVFSKFPMTVGQEIAGDIQINGQYHNFKWGKKSQGTFQKGGTDGDLNRVELKISSLMAQMNTIGGEITSIKSVLGEILQKVAPVDGQF